MWDNVSAAPYGKLHNSIQIHLDQDFICYELMILNKNQGFYEPYIEMKLKANLDLVPLDFCGLTW